MAQQLLYDAISANMMMVETNNPQYPMRDVIDIVRVQTLSIFDEFIIEMAQDGIFNEEE